MGGKRKGEGEGKRERYHKDFRRHGEGTLGDENSCTELTAGRAGE